MFSVKFVKVEKVDEKEVCSIQEFGGFDIGSHICICGVECSCSNISFLIFSVDNICCPVLFYYVREEMEVLVKIAVN